MIIYILHKFVSFISLFLTKEIFFFFSLMECTFLDCKQYVSVVIDTLISISEGLGPSFSVASYEGKDGWKSCLLPARFAIFYFGVIIYEVVSPVCILTWRVNNYVLARKGRNGRNESTNLELFRNL